MQTGKTSSKLKDREPLKDHLDTCDLLCNKLWETRTDQVLGLGRGIRFPYDLKYVRPKMLS